MYASSEFATLKQLLMDVNTTESETKSRPAAYDIFPQADSSGTSATVESSPSSAPSSTIAPGASKPKPDRPAPLPKKAVSSSELVQGASASSKAEVSTSEPMTTEMKFKCKIPFGHKLYIRGDKEAGLSWDKGVALEKSESEKDTLVYSFEGTSTKPVQFKVFLDDIEGESNNWTIEAGKTQEFTPALALPCVPIVVEYDAGDSGNKLYIRGEGPLSWDEGVLLKDLKNGYWVFELPLGHEHKPFEFKILINDKQWEARENHKTRVGTTMKFAWGA